MDVINIAQELMKFRTETGNIPEIMKCLNFAKALFNNKDLKGGIFELENAYPVL